MQHSLSGSIQNPSALQLKSKGDFSNTKIGIVVAEWNNQVTESMYCGAYELLIKEGIKKENIITKSVPGAFELTLGSQWMAQRTDIDAVIALGCVIQGDTPHFDFICQGVAYGITEVSLKYNKPVIFGVLTTLNLQQALDRSGGKHGNKGDEAAISALKMLVF